MFLSRLQNYIFFLKLQRIEEVKAKEKIIPAISCKLLSENSLL